MNIAFLRTAGVEKRSIYRPILHKASLRSYLSIAVYSQVRQPSADR